MSVAFVHHAIDLPHFYQPYIQKQLERFDAVAVAPYMSMEIMLPFRDRAYIAVSATAKAQCAPADLRVVGRRARVWQLVGDEAVRLGLGVAVAQKYRRAARRRWPTVRLINYEQLTCDCVGEGETE